MGLIHVIEAHAVLQGFVNDPTQSSLKFLLLQASSLTLAILARPTKY